MGKTSKPLAILVHPGLMEWAEVKALRKQGHLIVPLLGDEEVDIDLILAPNAWRMTEDLRPHFELVIKAARKAKYDNAKAEEE